MSKKRYIDTKFWSDGYIDGLDPIEKLLFLYLLTNERTNVAGIYELPVKLMATETGIEKNNIEKVLDRFVRDGKITRAESWVKLTNYQKHQNVDNPKIATGIERVISEVPSYVMDRLSIGYAYPSINSDFNFNSDLKNDTNVSLAKPKEYGNPDINLLFAYWDEATGIPVTGKKQANRNACHNLQRVHGTDRVKQLIDGVALAQQDRYAPRIADFVDLQTKLNQLLTWGKTRREGGVHVI